MDAKKEFTQNIVNNLKEKISEFKNRKKPERKDELDFEINKELIDKFRKNHSGNSNIDINERINEEKKNLGILINPNPNEDNKLNKILNNFENVTQQNKKSQSNNNLNIQSLLENKGNLQNLINNFTNQPEKEIKNNENDLNFIHKSKSNYNTLNSNLNQNNENIYKKDLLNNNIKNETNDNNNDREKQINLKKEEIMKDLLKNNNNDKKRKLSMVEKNSIRSNSFSLENYFSNEGSKDKLKILQKQLESNNYNNNKKKLNNYNGIPKYNYKNNNKVNDKIKYDFSSKFYNKNTNNLYKNNNNEIDNFADFTLKKGMNDKETLRIRTYSSSKVNNNINFNFDFITSKSNLNIYNNKNSNSNIILNENEIRALSCKIRFLSKEDIKNMNKTLIDELLSLSNSIKRTFQDYNNQNNNKIF